MLIGMVEVEGIPPPMMKPRLGPPLEEDPDVGITTDGMGVGMLGILTKGKEDTIDIPQMETPEEMHEEGVGMMALRDDKVDITGIPL
jgi:hypothetical protein